MDEIQAILPHRPPFLFVDRVVELGRDTIVCEWRVPEDADFLRGHYPDFPVVPGVLLSESVFQAGALLAGSLERGALEEGEVPVLTKITSARFRRMVRPGETVRSEVKLEERVGNARFFTGRASVEGARVLRIEFATAVVPAEQEEA